MGVRPGNSEGGSVMSNSQTRWPATKARLLLRALFSIGWTVKRQPGTSHRVLERKGWPDYTFPFHNGEEIGPRMLARIAKKTGLKPQDL